MRHRLQTIRNWPLSLKLASAIFVLALVPQLVVALVNADEVRTQLETRERDGLQRRAVEASRRIEERVGRLRAYSELLANNPLIVDALADRVVRPRQGSPASRQRRAVEHARAWDARHEDIHRLLQSARRSSLWFQHAYLLDATGLCISSSERDVEPEMIGRVYDYRPYYRAPVADAQPYVTDVLKNVHSPGTAIFISAPVLRGREVAGIVVIKVDTAALDDVVADLSALGGRVLFVDRFGVVVSDALRGRAQKVDDASSLQFRPLVPVDRYRTLFEDTRRYGDPLHEHHLDRVSMSLGLDDLWQKLRSAGTGAGAFAFPVLDDVAHNAMIGYAVVWAGPGDPYGYLVMAQPTQAFHEPLESLSRMVMLRAVFVAGVVALAMGFFIRRISSRVRRMVEATRAVAAGQIALRLDEPYRDELGELAASFDRVTQQLATTVESAERQRKEAELARLEAERAHATKDAFIANLGRQVAAPLEQLVAGVARLRTVTELGRDSIAEACIGEIDGANVALQRVVEQTRTLVGDDELCEQKVSLAPFFEALVQSMRPLAVLGASKLMLEIENDLGEATIDSAKLRQIVSALLDNAFKFTRQGEVKVTIRREQANPDILVVRISDTGIGMTRGQIERYESEQPTGAKADAHGTGFVISRLAARAMGARLTVQSEPGRGATFTVTLTLASR